MYQVNAHATLKNGATIPKGCKSSLKITYINSSAYTNNAFSFIEN